MSIVSLFLLARKDNYNINFAIDLPLCQTIHKIDLTFMVTLTVHQTYTAQSFRLPPYSLI